MSVDTSIQSLRALRGRQAGARANREEAIWGLKFAQAMAEQRCIDGLEDHKELGSNEAERTRALTLFLGGDELYVKARSHLRDAETVVAEIESEIETYYEVRRREREAIDRQWSWAILTASSEQRDPMPSAGKVMASHPTAVER